MDPHKLGDKEQQFADLIWEHAPIHSRELSEICRVVFDWKRTTTYTMLKRLENRKLFENQNGTVVACISKEEFNALQSERFLNETYGGSLPQFLAAFTRRNQLSDSEIKEIRELIDGHREE